MISGQPRYMRYAPWAGVWAMVAALALLWKSRSLEGVTKAGRSVQNPATDTAGPWNCTHSARPQISSATPAVAAIPIDDVRARWTVLRGRLAARTAAITAAT